MTSILWWRDHLNPHLVFCINSFLSSWVSFSRTALFFLRKAIYILSIEGIPHFPETSKSTYFVFPRKSKQNLVPRIETGIYWALAGITFKAVGYYHYWRLVLIESNTGGWTWIIQTEYWCSSPFLQLSIYNLTISKSQSHNLITLLSIDFWPVFCNLVTTSECSLCCYSLDLHIATENET